VKIGRITLIALSGLFLIALGTYIAGEQTEVAVLRTFDASGTAFETKMWVADVDGRPYVRIGRAGRSWGERLKTQPEVELVRQGATVRAYDPVATDNARGMLPASVVYCDSSYDAATGADGVALLTEWNEFKFLNLERLYSVMRRPLVFDGRNLWEPERMRRLGFEYHSIGRKPVVPA